MIIETSKRFVIEKYNENSFHVKGYPFRDKDDKVHLPPSYSCKSYDECIEWLNTRYGNYRIVQFKDKTKKEPHYF